MCERYVLFLKARMKVLHVYDSLRRNVGRRMCERYVWFLIGRINGPHVREVMGGS